MTTRRRAGARSLRTAAAPRSPETAPTTTGQAFTPEPAPAAVTEPVRRRTPPAKPKKASRPIDDTAKTGGTKAGGGIKYTATLDDDAADAFELLTRAARRRLQRHVDKVEILRALLLLAADDVSLRNQLVEQLDTSRRQ